MVGTFRKLYLQKATFFCNVGMFWFDLFNVFITILFQINLFGPEFFWTNENIWNVQFLVPQDVIQQ